MIIQASYTTLDVQLTGLGWSAVDGILLDFGMSSMQVDTPERGFSFLQDGPLDMRFDPHNLLSADTLVNELPEKELSDLIFRYGEERRSAGGKSNRGCPPDPLDTTTGPGGCQGSGGRSRWPASGNADFPGAANCRKPGDGGDRGGICPKPVDALDPGGRLAVISFHSLEDRLVKQYFRRESRDVCAHLASQFVPAGTGLR